MPGTPELLFIFVLILLLFGPDKIPELARQFGKLMRQVRRASDDIKSQFNFDLDDDDDEPRRK